MRIWKSIFSPTTLCFFLLGAMPAAFIQLWQKKRRDVLQSPGPLSTNRGGQPTLVFRVYRYSTAWHQQKCPVRLMGANETLIFVTILFEDSNNILISNGSCFSQESFRTWSPNGGQVFFYSLVLFKYEQRFRKSKEIIFRLVFSAVPIYGICFDIPCSNTHIPSVLSGNVV